MSTLDNVKRQQVYINKAKEKEKQYNIPENMLVGLLKTESGFREDVIQGRTKSSVGAIGIAQFMPNTAKEYGIDPLNVDQAIDGAARYLSKSYKTLGNWDDAIRSYNMGVGGVQAWKSGRKKLPKETAEYLPKVYKNAGLDYKYDTTIQQEQTAFDPDHYNNTIKPLNYLPQSNINTTFAGVPDSALPQEKTEEKEKTDKDIKELQTKTAEQNFLEELYQNNNREIVEQPQPQQQRTQAQPVDYMQMYEQVSNFVDTPLIGGEEQMMQQGGGYSENELAFLSEIAIKDNQGQRRFPNQITEIQGDTMATNGYGNIPLYVIPDKGKPKVIQANTGEHKFKGATKFIEIPLFKK